jgi:FSR family fosmidomycin resistance protein-like MFS transporter
MASTFFGLLLLSIARQYVVILIAAALVGLGSAGFHPESARIARLASGGRYGFAQSLFQLGGSFGTSMRPLLAALIAVPFG